MPELFTRYGKGRTRDATSKEIDSTKLRTSHLCDGILYDSPVRTILPKRVTSMGINLDRGSKLKSGSFKAYSLTSGPRANLKYR